MAIGFGTKLGEGIGTSSVTISTTSGQTAGTLIVVWVACDNTAGTDLPNISSVSLGGTGQTFDVVAEHGSSSTTASAATRGFLIVFTSANTTVATASLTVNFSAAPAKSVSLAASFTGVDISTVIDTASGTSTVGTPTASKGVTFPANDEYLWLGLASCENNAAWTGWNALDGMFGTVDAPGGDGDVFSTGGGAAANVAMRAGYDINISGGTGPFTIQGRPTGGSADSGTCWVIFRVATAGPTPKAGTDSAAGTDTATAKDSQTLESVAGTELANRAAQVLDLATATESASVSVSQTAADSATATEAVTARAIESLDSATGTEAVTARAGQTTEAAAGVELADRSAQVLESATATETAQVDVAQSAADSATATEQASLQAQTLEAVSATESASKTSQVLEGATATDVAQRAAQVLEAGTGSELANQAAQVLESATATEFASVEDLGGGGSVPVAASDSAAGTDTATVKASQILETAAVTESAGQAAQTLETAAATEVAARAAQTLEAVSTAETAARDAQVLETAAVTDVAQRAAQALEAGTATDRLAAWAGQVLDAATVTELAGRAAVILETAAATESAIVEILGSGFPGTIDTTETDTTVKTTGNTPQVLTRSRQATVRGG